MGKEDKRLTSEELRHLMDKFDPSGSGEIHYHRVVDWVHDQPNANGYNGTNSGYNAGNGNEQIEPYEVDRLMRGGLDLTNLAFGNGGFNYTNGNNGNSKYSPVGNSISSRGGTEVVTSALNTLDASQQHQHQGPYQGHGGGNAGPSNDAASRVDLWHPSTVSEWLGNHASAAERADFDEIYQSIADQSCNNNTTASSNSSSYNSSSIGNMYSGLNTSPRHHRSRSPRRQQQQRQQQQRTNNRWVHCIIQPNKYQSICQKATGAS